MISLPFTNIAQMFHVERNFKWLVDLINNMVVVTTDKEIRFYITNTSAKMQSRKRGNTAWKDIQTWTLQD